MPRLAALIPAYQAERTIAGVVGALLSLENSVFDVVVVVDDGSADQTEALARQAGAKVLRHPRNSGKGAALKTGFEHLRQLGYEAAVTVDADGQHPAGQAALLAQVKAPANALVLGVRNLKEARAPRANQFSNRLANFFLSAFSGKALHDTQCGLRRYPLQETLALGCRDNGFAFESEVLLLALRQGLPVVEVPVRVLYPQGSERQTHFDSVKDPARIIARVVKTLI